MSADTASFDVDVNEEHFRVAIFGSARIEQNDATYRTVYELAKHIGEAGYDIVTGGGPGLMEAANAGHEAGDPSNKTRSLGLLIKLPNEQRANSHLDIKQEYSYFTQRLQGFIQLSNAVVVAPGGIGTFLELVYTWQLEQVGFVRDIPIILLGEMWEELVQWVQRWQVANAYIDPEDLNFVFCVKDEDVAMQLITQTDTLCNIQSPNVCQQLRKQLVTDGREDEST